MCTQMQRLKLNMNAVNQVKHSNCSLKSKSLHEVLNAISQSRQLLQCQNRLSGERDREYEIPL